MGIWCFMYVCMHNIKFNFSCINYNKYSKTEFYFMHTYVATYIKHQISIKILIIITITGLNTICNFVVRQSLFHPDEVTGHSCHTSLAGQTLYSTVLVLCTIRQLVFEDIKFNGFSKITLNRIFFK